MTKHNIKRVLVAIKPRERGLPLAAYHARYLAQSLDAEIALVSCVYDSHVALGLSGGDPTAISAQAGLIENERAMLEGLVQSLRDWGVTVTTRINWYTPVYEGILDEVREWKADLLVLGAHEPRAVLDAYLTDTDWQLMRLCPCPLLLVKDLDFEQYPRILAAIDPLHRHAEPAGLDRAVLDMTRTLGHAFDAKLSVANAYPDPQDYEFASSVEVLPGVFYGTENIEALHRKAVEELVDNYGITAEQMVLRPGDPTTVISEIVTERDIKLVVVGATKRSRIEAAVLGSTAESVAAQVPCDVLLLKPPVL